MFPIGFRFFSHPAKDTFQLSLTLLVNYRSRVVFRIGSLCLPHSRAISNARYSGSTSWPYPVRIRDFHPLWCAVPGRLLLHGLRQQVSILHISPRFPKEIRFVLFRFHSPLLTEFLLISFPPPTEMLQFGGFPFLRKNTRNDCCQEVQFGNSRIKEIHASPRDLSQLVTTFVGSRAEPSPNWVVASLFLIVLTNVRPLVSRHINSGFSGHYVSPQGAAASTTYPDRQSIRAHKAGLRPTYGI